MLEPCTTSSSHSNADESAPTSPLTKQSSKVRLVRALTSTTLEVILASCLASIPLTYLLEPGDYRIVKIIVFSRAVTNAVHLAGDLTGLFKPVEGRGEDPRWFTIESALGVAASTFCCYAFVYEPEAMTQSLRQQFIRGTNMTLDERKLFDAVRASREIEKRMW